MTIRHTLLATLLTFLVWGNTVYADDVATISLNPENPTPRSSVVLTLESYDFDTSTVMITWTVNGKVILKGPGERRLTVKTGGVGEITQVKARANRSDGSLVEQTVNITPSSVSLLYEAPTSYVPLLYKGRSLPADGASFRVTALPQISDRGVLVPASSLAYSWYINDTYLDEASGYGKQSANLKIDYINPETEVRVLVRSPYGNRAENTIAITPHEVMPLIYLYDDILGTRFSKLLTRRYETIKDFTVALEPFYVSLKEDGDTPTYSWFLDGEPSTPLGGRLLTFHLDKNSIGTKLLEITVKGPTAYLQKAETAVELIFDTR